MAITIAQHTIANVNASSITKAFASNNTAGNIGVAFVFFQNITSINNFSDSSGNTWVFLTSGTDTVNAGITSVYYCLNLKGGVAANITVGLVGTSYLTLALIEGAAGAGFVWSTDGHAYNFASGTAISSGNFTTTGANDLIAAYSEAGAGTITPTGGLTALDTDPGNNIGTSMWKTTSASGTQSATATLAPSGNWDMSGVAFFAQLSSAIAKPVPFLLDVYHQAGMIS